MLRVIVLSFALLSAGYALAAELSPTTAACLDCHRTVTPGIVSDWGRSRHAQVSLKEALAKGALERRISLATIPKDGGGTVGCAECHTINSRRHKDTFAHEGYKVHVVVTPQDCATCHPTEVKEYGQNLMSYAHVNLNMNPVYRDLMEAINGFPTYENMKVTYKKPDDQTDAESCNYCHGTLVEVRGIKAKATDFGEMGFPILTGWPNQGAGRINPDGSRGTCTACHTRHQFSLQMARKPYTCAECHKGPDVPAYKVYEVSKHGNLYLSLSGEWGMDDVPWRVGKDFTAPTCATCHISLIVTDDGDIVAQRTHKMNDRLPWRLFGLIYAHPHPQFPNTSLIKNKAGLFLPTELTGEPVATYLIDAQEQAKRRHTMERVCLCCHQDGWVKGQWERLENTIRTTNVSTLAATKILLAAWEAGLAKGLADGDSIFNEALEKRWVEHWLFYANSTRFASAMGGADYGVFAHGRWQMDKNLQEMVEWLQKAKDRGK